MIAYSLILAKLAIGLLNIIFLINFSGKGNLAPNSAMDQVQNYVLGGIIGGVIYNPSIGMLEFMLILLIWSILIMTVRYLKTYNQRWKQIIDGKPTIIIEKGRIITEHCLQHGLNGSELHLKLRAAGVNKIQDVKRAVLEQNGQLTIVQQGEDNIRFPLISDGQIMQDVLELIDKDEAWLLDELKKQHMEPSKVFIGEYVDGQLILYPY